MAWGERTKRGGRGGIRREGAYKPSLTNSVLETRNVVDSGITNGITRYNGITMALSNAERQRRWLAKHRALHNFGRRKKKGGDATCQFPTTSEMDSSETTKETGSNAEPVVRSSGSAFETKKVGELLRHGNGRYESCS